MAEAIKAVAERAQAEAAVAHLRGLVFLPMPYLQHWTSSSPRRRQKRHLGLMARQAIIPKSIYRLAKPTQAR